MGAKIKTTKNYIYNLKNHCHARRSHFFVKTVTLLKKSKLKSRISTMNLVVGEIVIKFSTYLTRIFFLRGSIVYLACVLDRICYHIVQWNACLKVQTLVRNILKYIFIRKYPKNAMTPKNICPLKQWVELSNFFCVIAFLDIFL